MDISQLGIILLIAANVLYSYKGLKDRSFFKANLFSTGGVLVNKEYLRLISSGFLHVNWTHLFFNMFTLYSFGGLLFHMVGPVKFFAIYFTALIGGNLLSLFFNRHDYYYTAVGASGAVSGVLFASIAMYPGIGVSLMFIPIAIPGWIFGIVFILYSVYGMHKGADNIGHDAHLGGAIIGLLITIAFYPSLFMNEPLIITALLVPSIGFLIFLLKKPTLGSIVTPHAAHPHNQTIDDEYNAKREEERKEIDRILDKINTKGRDHLTKEIGRAHV